MNDRRRGRKRSRTLEVPPLTASHCLRPRKFSRTFLQATMQPFATFVLLALSLLTGHIVLHISSGVSSPLDTELPLTTE
ncbi:UNVERIFIED_CONTAM: hypothetical protein K2H54_032635, partial [Gekko kuhli]